MSVGQEGVGAPEDDESAVCEVLRVDPEGKPGHIGCAQPCGHAAEMAPDVRGVECVEEAVGHHPLLDHALRSVERERQDRLRPPGISEGAKSIGDLTDRLGPRDGLEVSRSLRADAAQRMKDPVGVVDPIEEPVDLGAELAAGGGVLRRSPEADRRALLHRHLPDTRVRAVVVTGAEDHRSVQLHSAQWPCRSSEWWNGVKPTSTAARASAPSTASSSASPRRTSSMTPQPMQIRW